MTVQTDLVVTGAPVVTMDPRHPEADAMGIADGRIAFVGRREAIRDRVGDVTEIDVGGGVILPGLIDAHAHLEVLAIGADLAVNHRSPPVETIDHIVEAFRARAATTPPGRWIIGQGSHFQDQLLHEGRYPDRFDLDRASTEHPMVARFSFHINVLNSRAISELALTPQTPEPRGGRFERMTDGELTGRTFDVYNSLDVPPWPADSLRPAFVAAANRYLAAGVTTVADIQIQDQGLPLLLDLARTEGLKLRVLAYPTVPKVLPLSRALDDSLDNSFNGVDPLLASLGGVKVFVDGGLTSAAAALHEPYPHLPGYRGEIAFEPEELADLFKALDARGHQLLVHAIGDRALDVTLDAFGTLPRRLREAPLRIEHGGNAFATAERLGRMRHLGVLPVPNPAFIYTIAAGYREYLGEERATGLFPFRSLLAAGFELPGNSDSVGVELRMHEPLFGIWCLTARKTKGGDVVDLSEAISVVDGLRMYTDYAAASLGVRNSRGSLTPGKLADFVVLDRDPRDLKGDELLEVRVQSTWVGGRCVYEA